VATHKEAQERLEHLSRRNLCMRKHRLYLPQVKRVALAFLAVVCLFSTLASGQVEAADIQKLRRAEQAADRFTERFSETLDFGVVWREFRSTKFRSSVYFQDAITGRREGRTDINDALIERGFVAFMNYVYLKFAHDLGVSHIGSEPSDEEITPVEIQEAERVNKYINFDDNEREPKNAKELVEYIAEADKLAKLYRKYVSRSTFDSAVYKENLRYLARFYGRSEDKYRIVKVDEEMGLGKGVKEYRVTRGAFHYAFIEEGKEMKLIGIGMGN